MFEPVLSQEVREADGSVPESRPLERFAEALFDSALLLSLCRRRATATEESHELRSALRMNGHLWSLFQGEALDPERELPREIYGDIQRLGLRVHHLSGELLHTFAPDKLDGLIEINRHLASDLAAYGLRGSSSTAGS